MYFPQGSANDELAYAGIAGPAEVTVPAGKTKLGSLACVEAQFCKRAGEIYAAEAAKLGFDYVYRRQASIATPDFTAECLSARNAGVQVLLLIMDNNSISRITSSCARQGYRPTYGTLSVTQRDAQKTDKNLDGLIVASPVFPYFQSGTPATDDFQQAMRTYGASVPEGVARAQGWVAGKLLEKAGAALSEPPTSASLLAGLWAFQNDTLGGLTIPLTFVKEQPAAPKSCWYTMVIKDGSWTATDGKLHCRK
jgi:branched-chain amino acid transport system substrate-binding protein